MRTVSTLGASARTAVTRRARDRRTAARPAAARGRTRRAGSSRRAAAARPRPGRSTIHSQRPSASPATTERSHSPRPRLVETGQSGIDWQSIRTRTVGGPSPTSVPGSSWRVPAMRAPRPVPGSSLITRTSTGPSRVDWCRRRRSSRPGRGRRSPTAAKSVTRQPGLSGHGRYVGKRAVAPRCSTNASYDASVGPPERLDRRRGRGRTTASPAWAIGVEQRGQPTVRAMLNRPRRAEARSRVPAQHHRVARARGRAREMVAGVEREAAARRRPAAAASGRSAPAARGRARTPGRRPSAARHRATTRSSRADTWSAVSPPGHGCVQTVQPGTDSRISSVVMPS